MISGGTSAWAASGAAVRSAAPGTGSTTSVGSGSATAAKPSGCHVLDHALAVERRGLVLRDHPPEIEDSDPIRHLENIVQVVRDHHHSETAVAQSLDQVQHHAGLHHAQGGGGLVHDHELRVPHHCLGHCHRLALAA